MHLTHTLGLLFLLPVLAGTGCHHPPLSLRTTQAASFDPSPRIVSTEIGSTTSNGYPPETEEYYVGMIPDPEDPRFAYRPGTLLVERRPNRLRLAGDEIQVAPVFQRGPVSTARLADDHPEYTTAELSSLAVRSQQLIASMTEEIDRLRTQSTKVNNEDHLSSSQPDTRNAGETFPRPRTALAVASQQGPGQKSATHLAIVRPGEFNLVRPNSENVIELDPALFTQPAASDGNPFVQVYQQATQLREITVIVSAAVPGPTPTAVINDVPYALHSQFQGLDVHQIEPDAVYLRKDTFLFVCPVSEKPLRLRLP